MNTRTLLTLMLAAWLFAGLHLSAKSEVPDLALNGQEVVQQTQQGGLTVRLKPGFQDGQASPAEIDLIEAWLPGILDQLAGEYKKTPGDASQSS